MIEALGTQPWWILTAIAAVAFLESFALIGLLLPGVVMLFTLAALAGNLDLFLPAVLVAAALGACAGDISSYFIGRWLQPRIAHWRWFERHQTVLEQGHWFFVRWGWLGVAVGRFIGPIRPVIPLVAGTLAMPARLFISVSLVSVLVWAPAYILPGYLTGEVVGLLEQRSLSDRTLAATALAGGLILLAGLTIYHHMHPDHPRTARLLPFIRTFPPDFPFASLALALLALIVLLWLGLASPLVWDGLLLEGSSLWRDSGLTPWVERVRHLSAPALLLLITLTTALWLWLRGHHMASLHWLLLLGLFSLVAGLLDSGSLSALVDQSSARDSLTLLAMAETTTFVLCLGLLSAFFNEGRPANRRWQLYLPAGVLMVLMGLSGLWLGLYQLSDALAAMSLALLISALTRVSYTSLSPKRLNLDHSAAFITLIGVVAVSFLVLTTGLPTH